jgi:hypothetical protein
MPEYRKYAYRETCMRRVAPAVLLAAVAVFVIPAPAAAYIDPVSGSVLLQIVSAAVLAGVATIGRARNWLFSLIRRRAPDRSHGNE